MICPQTEQILDEKYIKQLEDMQMFNKNVIKFNDFTGAYVAYWYNCVNNIPNALSRKQLIEMFNELGEEHKLIAQRLMQVTKENLL